MYPKYYIFTTHHTSYLTSYILHLHHILRNITYYIRKILFIIPSSYIKILYLTCSPHIKRLYWKILHLLSTSKNITYYIGKILHLISSSHNKNITLENPTSNIYINNLISCTRKYYILNLHCIKIIFYMGNLTP